jgi:hypothetical protein
MSFDFDNPPEWARSWCYVFFLGAIALFLGAAITASRNAKRLGVWGITALMLLASAQAATQLTVFWMCRRSL